MNNLNIYTTKDLQAILKCGKNQAYLLMKSDCFPSVRINSKYIVTEENLISWLQKNRGKHVII